MCTCQLVDPPQKLKPFLALVSGMFGSRGRNNLNQKGQQYYPYHKEDCLPCAELLEECLQSLNHPSLTKKSKRTSEALHGVLPVFIQNTQLTQKTFLSKILKPTFLTQECLTFCSRTAMSLFSLVIVEFFLRIMSSNCAILCQN